MDSGQIDPTLIKPRIVQEILNNNVLETHATIFEYQGNKLVKMLLDNDAGYANISYQGDFLSKQEIYVNNQLFEYYDFVYSGNKLIQINNYDLNLNEKFTLSVKTEYKHNSDGTIEEYKTSYTTGQGVPTGQKKYWYDSSGDMIKEEYLGFSPSKIRIYEYDNKHNPFKNITGYKFFIESYVHNVVKSYSLVEGKPYLTDTYNYQYNSQDFPVSYQGVNQGSTKYNFTY